MKRVCFVIQRYGLEVNGGAELQCRLFAEHLKDRLSIEVLTTKAVDHISWANEYTEDVSSVNGITVRRFRNSRERDIVSFGELNGTFMEEIAGDPEKEDHWLIEQGPVCPDLIEYIHTHQKEFDVFIFSTYLYYTTIYGIRGVEKKSILIPEAHNEPCIHMSLLKDVFQKTAGLLYNTEIEKDLVEGIFHVSDTPHEIAGIGIDQTLHGNPEAGKKKYGLDRYIVYIGRIDEGKRCHVLFEYFQEYKKRNENDVKLVLMGKEAIGIPETDDIRSLGFVSEEDKCNVLSGAIALVLPSEFESLSMVVLEAMKLRVPVLVNEACEVVKNHCLKSNAGLFYYNYFDFEGALNWMIDHPLRMKVMGENGTRYVTENYNWDVVTDRILKLIDLVAEESRAEDVSEA